MMSTRHVVGHLIVATLPAVLAAQSAQPSAAHQNAMRRLAYLAGEWEGPATLMGPQGQRTLRQTESARFVLEGTALVIEGTGWDGDQKAFNALAVVSWTPEDGYRMRSWLMTGETGEFPLEVSDSGFAWTRRAGPGQIRYVMRLSPQGEWHEVGEWMVEGQPPRQVIQLKVRRK